MASRQAPRYDVAIVGGGFSGSLVAVRLARDGGSRLRIALIERSGQFGPGLAYGSASAEALLNVPAGRMGAFPEKPEGFVEWLRAHPRKAAAAGIPKIDPDAFLPRFLYGAYLSDLVRKTARESPGLERIEGEALDLRRERGGGFLVPLRDGGSLRAGRVVLAVGNSLPAPLPLRDEAYRKNPRYLCDPWTPRTRRKLAAPGDVLILGSGLTCLDLLAHLDGEKPSGTIHILSRHGLFPLPHAPGHPAATPLQADPLRIKSARELLHAVRSQVRGSKEGWYGMIEALRPLTQKIWGGLAVTERRRLLRHLRPYWEALRHRVEPAIVGRKEEMERRGRLQCHRGRILGIEATAKNLEVRFLPWRGKEPQKLRVAHVVNCTGPASDCRKADNPLLRNLLASGTARPGPLGLGLDTTRDGRVRPRGGAAHPDLWAIGPLRKGTLWECTAVRELRAQAAEIARAALTPRPRARRKSAA